MEKEKREDNVSANDKEVVIVPRIEQVEYERVAYIKGMEDYLQKLRSMPNNEAVKKSKISLMSCHIIQEDGEFTEKYSYSRTHTKHKE